MSHDEDYKNVRGHVFSRLDLRDQLVEAVKKDYIFLQWINDGNMATVKSIVDQINQIQAVNMMNLNAIVEYNKIVAGIEDVQYLGHENDLPDDHHSMMDVNGD